MSLYSSVAQVRFGNLGIFSVGVLAFALVTLQGCAPTVTASSARDFGAPVPGLGSLRADDAPRSEPAYHAAERTVADRAPSIHATRFRVR